MLASDWDIVRRSGPQYSYVDSITGEITKGLGREKFLQIMKDDEELFDKISEDLRSVR